MRTRASPPRVFAIVPAAGRSRRMGRPKQLIDVRGRPMLLAVVEPLLAAGAAGVVVVTRGDIRAALAQHPLGGAQPRLWFAENADPDAEMIDSVRIGVRFWRARLGTAGDAQPDDAGVGGAPPCAARPGDGLLICPGDQPDISAADINLCIRAFRESPRSIVIAARAGRRGHPIVFPVADADFVESPACSRGLNALPRSAPARVRLIECPSAGVTRDIDTPKDLAGELSRTRRRLPP